MNKAESIKTASRVVSIHGQGTSWMVIHPFYASNPSGPSTQSNAGSYSAAVAKASAIKAGIAIELYEGCAEHVSDVMWSVEDGMKWRDAVGAVITQQKQRGTYAPKKKQRR